MQITRVLFLNDFHQIWVTVVNLNKDDLRLEMMYRLSDRALWNTKNTSNNLSLYDEIGKILAKV